MTKVAHLTSVHPPSDIRIFLKECLSLAAAGYSVVLIAQGEGDSSVGGVRVRSVPKARSQIERMTRTVVQVLRAAIEEDARLYHFHDPELLPVGILLKLFGKRVIYDVHENVPEDILTKDYLPLWARRWVAAMAAAVERLGAKCFDGIVAVTPGIASRFPHSKTVLARNFPVAEELIPSSINTYSNRPNVLIYAGRISVERGVREMVQAMALLPDHLGARLELAGAFTPTSLHDQALMLNGADRVDFKGWLSRNDIKTLYSEARVGLALFHPGPNHLDSYPNKLFEYMAAGIPVVASNFPLWKEFVEKARCGLMVDPLDVQAVSAAIRWLLEHPEEAEAMGQRGMQAVAGDFNWRKEADTLLQFYARIMGK